MDPRTKANHQSWLNDSITQRLIEQLEVKCVDKIPAALIAARRAGNTAQLNDLVADLELTKAMIKQITTGEFLN